MKKAIIILILCGLLSANDLIPGAQPPTPVAVIHATLHTVANGVIKDGTLVFDKGIINAVGREVTVPDNARIIDAGGAHVYPGLIAGKAVTGLVEIGAVRATRDISETGAFNPNVRAETAYNTDSEVTPTLRSNGLTAALITPEGGRIAGLGAVMFFDGWNKNDARVKSDAVMLMNWPGLRLRYGPGSPPVEKQKEKIRKSLKELEDFFDKATDYHEARKNGNALFNIRFESMIHVLEGDIPLLIRANDLKQIRQAVRFCAARSLKMILLEGADSWKAVDLLRRHGIPVILRQPHSLPYRADENYDQPFKTPALLAGAGIPFALTKTGADAWDIRNLPFWGATMVAYGLSKEDALKSMTLWPARMFGVDKQLGSLEKGKNATFFISEGDVLDYAGHHVTLMFINGKPVDLDNRQKRLYRKYGKRIERALK